MILGLDVPLTSNAIKQSVFKKAVTMTVNVLVHISAYLIHAFQEHQVQQWVAIVICILDVQTVVINV